MNAYLIVDPNVMSEDRVLDIPEPEFVMEGESFEDIAKKLGATIVKKKYNRALLLISKEKFTRPAVEEDFDELGAEEGDLVLDLPGASLLWAHERGEEPRDICVIEIPIVDFLQN